MVKCVNFYAHANIRAYRAVARDLQLEITSHIKAFGSSSYYHHHLLLIHVQLP